MKKKELHERLEKFCRAKYKDNNAKIFKIKDMPGHAGFSYGFSVYSKGKEESWYIRMPPPDVQWKGTADVLRQVEILKALNDTDVPHCSVKWSGDDLEWFGCPYFVVPFLEGDIIRLKESDGWVKKLSQNQLYDLGKQIMSALAGIHRVNWREKTPRLGKPIPYEQDVIRWDRFLEKAAEQQRFVHAKEVRKKLLERYPAGTPVGVFHGDYQPSNLFCSYDGKLIAVIDWELASIGSTLNDVGWIATFSDSKAWSTEGINRTMFLDPDTLLHMYADAYGSRLPDVRWFRALAAYKYAVISGLNLSLHRRGKRPDPLWEDLRFSINTLIDRALELLNEM